MRFLITGASGMLGSDLGEIFTEKFGKANVFAFDHKGLDITNQENIRAIFSEFKPSIVINAAAYTNVDLAESEREKSHAINALGPKYLSSICEIGKIKLVHFSTDYVFDGSGQEPWTENSIKSPPKPNYYAETKLEGEEAVLKDKNALVLRVQWLYGKKRDRFTVLRDKETFTPLVDQWGAPTWTKEIVRIVCALLEKNASGIFHLSYDDSASWLEVYEFVKKELALSTTFMPKKSSDLNLAAIRPQYCVMSNRKLLSALGINGMGSWKTPLREFLHSQ